MFRDMWADLGLRAVGWSAARRGEDWLVFGGMVWCVLPAGRGSAVMQDMASWLKNSFGDMGKILSGVEPYSRKCICMPESICGNVV